MTTQSPENVPSDAEILALAEAHTPNPYYPLGPDPFDPEPLDVLAFARAILAKFAAPATVWRSVQEGWKLVPVEPTEEMITLGFESAPSAIFSIPDEWEAYRALSGCEQAAHRTRLCWKAMLDEAPTPPAGEGQEPVAWIVYLPSEDAERIYDSQEDEGYVDDLTNNPDAEVSPLYTHPAPTELSRISGEKS